MLGRIGCLLLAGASLAPAANGQGLSGLGQDSAGAPVPLRPRDSAPPPVQRAFPEDRLLSWDAVHKEIVPGKGDKKAFTHFSVTNATRIPVTITQIRPSCGCTLAKSPPLPWRLLPGEGDRLDLEIGVEGKSGSLEKSVRVYSTAGIKTLTFKVVLPEREQMSASERMANIRLATRDRQVVFRGKCKSCHFDPAVGAKGEELYQAACAICHDSPHRASMVPFLGAYKPGVRKNEAYWRMWIAHGRPGTLMPAFDRKQGGPLEQEQIDDLVAWLGIRFPEAPARLQGTPLPGGGASPGR